MIKPLSIALALGLAAASVSAYADDTTAAGSHMQQCVSKEKAKNDGRSDSDISQACTMKMQQKHQAQSNSVDGSMSTPGTTPSATTPTSPTYPNNTTPNETNQVPK